ncbi:MAG: SAM-dependent methyltransferase [Cytophagaceae bacterium SCN 52-12]|nr:MAG: SAM-dependent methyltransferase [Cytophagaceae bacterium SCN 52-12]
MNNTVTLYLIPTVLTEGTAPEVLPAGVIQALQTLDVFFVENVRTARRFISSLKIGKRIDEITFHELHKDTPREETRKKLGELHTDAGIISEAGVPCVADPGSIAVGLAHELGYRVKPLVGPSSILLALMGSGFTGQSFSFHGYLPIDRAERAKTLRHLEKEAAQSGQTQIFMETPYRNNQMLQTIMEVCQPATSLCIAANLTGGNELMQTRSVAQWRKGTPDINRQPAIFLIGVREQI